MFHNRLLTHKCLLAHIHITDNFISHMRQRPIRFCIIYCQFCHTPIIALSKYSYIHKFSDKPLATRISENIHKVRWEKSRYANFPSITPPQVLCIPRGGGWDRILYRFILPYFSTGFMQARGGGRTFMWKTLFILLRYHDRINFK